MSDLPIRGVMAEQLIESSQMQLVEGVNQLNEWPKIREDDCISTIERQKSEILVTG